MSSNKPFLEFPDAEAKLQKPTKKSAFEKQKAEAEAKKRREEEETAVVLQGFLKDFAQDVSDDDGGIFSQKARQGTSKFGSGPPERQGPFLGSSGGAGKRHFGVPSGGPLKSGPGSLGPIPKSGPGSLGPVPTAFGKKRSYDGFQSGYQQRGPGDARGRPGFDDHRETGPLSISKAFDDASDDEEKPTTTGRAEEKAVAKPTLRLVNLPPNTSPLAIKALIPSTLTVENVKIAPPSGPGGGERKSITAIVTLATETSAKDIDAVVSSLQNKYLGYGYYLSLHRHLSSAAITSGLPIVHSSTAVTQPFGAKKVDRSRRNYGPGLSTFNHGVPPPDSYDGLSGFSNGMGPRFHVPVRPPRNIRMLRMIHSVVESVLKHGPEFEALLMSRPDVQREEKWAWIWDARSEGGIWYRWRLWEVATGSSGSRSKREKVRLFQGKDTAFWEAPEQPLPFEFATYVDEFASDDDYVSEQEDLPDDNENKVNNEEDMFLNPIDKAKLAYLLGRLPATLSKLRKGDIARVTAFALTHASRGADEVVDMVLKNVESPFAFSSANAERRARSREEGGRGDSGDTAPTGEANPEAQADSPEKDTAAYLIGLYIVSDIVFCSGNSSLRHAWRFRQIFETALRRRKTFEILGKLSEKLNLGLLRAAKWKRSVRLVLDLWESWSAFSGETQAYFLDSFENSQTSKKEEPTKDSGEQEKKSGRWKTIDANTGSGSLPVSAADQLPVSQAGSPPAQNDDYGDALDASQYSDEEPDSALPKMHYYLRVDQLSLFDDGLDGEPYYDDGTDGEDGRDLEMQQQDTIMKDVDDSKPAEIKLVGGFRISAASKNAAAPRKRMQAMDMFADKMDESD